MMNDNNDNDNDEHSHPDEETLRDLDVELSRLERGLETPRSLSCGRAAFDSVTDTLRSIRRRLEDVAPERGVERLSERLRTAQLAHASRIPLGLLRGSNADLQRQRESSRAQILSNAATQHKPEEAEEEDLDTPTRPDGTPRTTRRSSTLVASRTRAAEIQGFPLDQYDESVTTNSNNNNNNNNNETTLLPEQVARETDQQDTDQTQETQLPTALLLTKTQSLSLLRSSRSLSGSVQTEGGSRTYSWGYNGIQSLHDDAQDRTVHEAQVSHTSRIGRPDAAAVLSVATGVSHTVVANAQGQVLSCGYNRCGAVDPDATQEEVIPKPRILEALVNTRILQVSCGLDHTAALNDHGVVLTWGSNLHGQLGHKPSSEHNTFCRPEALIMTGGRRGAAVACGHYFTLVLTTRMSVLTCGTETITGRIKDDKEPGKVSVAATIPALEGLPLVAVSAGHHHAVVLTAGGTAYSWGANLTGCCGRPYPIVVSVPVEIHVPETSQNSQTSVNVQRNAHPFPNWAVWNDQGLTLADDVAIVHAACGDNHTVLVTRSGRLLVCGDNEEGQLGLMATDEPVSPAQPLDHPDTGRRFVTAEAGEALTLLLDDVGDVWQMGGGYVSGPECVLAGKKILTIAAGGKGCIAVGASGNGSSLRRQFSVNSANSTSIMDGSLLTESLEDLLQTVSQSESDDECTAAGEEIAKRAQELLQHPAVMNSIFFDPTDFDQIYTKLVTVGGENMQQMVATAIEKGIEKGLESIAPDQARLMYPEAVRCLLLYIHFFDRDEESGIVFDTTGNAITALCDTILTLPFEGYKAFLTWATTLYTRELFSRMLVRPLLIQLNRGLKIEIDKNGVQHMGLSRRAVPSIIAVLNWLYKASELKGGIAKPEDFYSDAISEIAIEALYDDLLKYKKSTKSQRGSTFFLCASPFLFKPSTKRSLLKVENQVEMFKVAASEGLTYDPTRGQFQMDPFWKLEIEREYLLEQTFAKIKETKATTLRKKLVVVFKDEEGVDAGGVTKEFFQLLSEELFNISSGMWSNRYGDSITWFNSDCSWDFGGYELTGILFGLALYNSVQLDVRFPIAVYRKLLGFSLGLEDMVDEDVKRSLQHLLDYDRDDVEDVFCLNFEVSWMDLGEERHVELKPGGANIPVTNDNKEEYVLLYVKWLLVDSIKPQWEAFEKGVVRVMEGSSLHMFRPDELELLVIGSPALDFEALEASTEYEGGYTADSDVIKNFWRFIKSSDRDSQLKFLKFAIGTSLAPIGGLGELGFKIQRAGPDSPQLPTSHTCFNTLLLPDYGDDYEKLAQRLGRAILECEGFGLA